MSTQVNWMLKIPLAGKIFTTSQSRRPNVNVFQAKLGDHHNSRLTEVCLQKFAASWISSSFMVEQVKVNRQKSNWTRTELNSLNSLIEVPKYNNYIEGVNNCKVSKVNKISTKKCFHLSVFVFLKWLVRVDYSDVSFYHLYATQKE